jgi:head-tail adaptor
MRAGRLDRFITIQRSTSTAADDGHPTLSWSTVGQLRTPASMTPISGDEKTSAPQYVAKEQVEFRVRYSDDLSELSPMDRIIYPAFEANSPAVPETRRTYDIFEVLEIGRREGLKILAARRADVRT